MENKFVYNSEQYKDDVKKTVKEDIVEVLGVEPEEVVDSANLINDLGADSLDIVELAMNLEKDFNIRIPDEIIEGKNESFFTVSFVVDIVKKYLNEKI